MSKKITMQDVADYVGVSKVTVSKALRGNHDISEAMAEKIRQTAAALGYVYQRAVLPSNDLRTHQVSVITSQRYFGQDDSFYVELYKLLASHFERIRYTAVLHILSEAEEREEALPRIVTDGKVDGVVVLGQISRKYIEKIIALRRPLVFLDFYYDRYPVDSINTDNFFGAYEITNTLIRYGHKKIAFVGNITLTSSIQDRYLGYLKSMLEHGLSTGPEWLIHDRTDESRWIDIVLPQEMPTAFVCNCDKTARMLIRNLNQCGLLVPEDCSVVGFDDSMHAVEGKPAITTVRVNLDEMARVTVKTFAKRLTDQDSKRNRVLIGGDIVNRESVSRFHA